MKQHEFLNELATVLEIDSKNLTDDFELKHCVTWDSLAMATVIGLLASAFKKDVTIKEVECVNTVKDLKQLLPLHQQS